MRRMVIACLAAFLVTGVRPTASVPRRTVGPDADDDPAAGAHTATAADGRVLIAGGCTEDGCGGTPDGVRSEFYEPATRRFVPGPPMVHARVGHTATPLADGRVLVAGGWPDEGRPPLSSVEVYDPPGAASSRWAAMATGRGGPHRHPPARRPRAHRRRRGRSECPLWRCSTRPRTDLAAAAPLPEPAGRPRRGPARRRRVLVAGGARRRPHHRRHGLRLRPGHRPVVAGGSAAVARYKTAIGRPTRTVGPTSSGARRRRPGGPPGQHRALRPGPGRVHGRPDDDANRATRSPMPRRPW
jgi:hypothetical protein